MTEFTRWLLGILRVTLGGRRKGRHGRGDAGLSRALVLALALAVLAGLIVWREYRHQRIERPEEKS
jgi:cytochrome b subunit of formate dehydrogenase